MPRSNYSSEAEYRKSKGGNNYSFNNSRRDDISSAWDKAQGGDAPKMKKKKGKKYGGSNAGGATIGGGA